VQIPFTSIILNTERLRYRYGSPMSAQDVNITGSQFERVVSKRDSSQTWIDSSLDVRFNQPKDIAGIMNSCIVV
jgi:hypothetical protein